MYLSVAESAATAEERKGTHGRVVTVKVVGQVACNSDTFRVSETGSKQIEKSITILHAQR